jgi:hypothetical protein
MVSVSDIEKLIEEFMLDKDITFKAIKPYLLSEFEWKTEPGKQYEFLIRNMPLPDDEKVVDYLKKFLPVEVLLYRETY